MASQQTTNEQEPDAPSTLASPTSSLASTTTTTQPSPLRRRLDRQKRQEALDHLTKMHRNRSGPSQDAPTCIAPSSPPLSPASDVSLKKESLVEKQARLFGGVVSKKRHSHFHGKPDTSTASSSNVDHAGDEEKKSSASGGGTTVTTATASTALTNHAAQQGYAALMDDSSDQTPKRMLSSDSSQHQEQHATTLSPTKRRPQHLETHEEEQAEIKYYRITYPGVVALLSAPDPHAPKSGAYVSYGEVVGSRSEVEVLEGTESPVAPGVASLAWHAKSLSLDEADTMQCASPESPQSLPRSLLSNTGSVSSLDTSKTNSTAGPIATAPSNAKVRTVTIKVIRVEEVLTGGYAVDRHDQVPSSLTTPKRSNIHYMPMVGASPMPLHESRSLYSSTDVSSKLVSCDPSDDASKAYGYLALEKKHSIIAELIAVPPLLESGKFLFSIVSSTPLPILTGPSLDAPKTKAMLLPGTVHEVCLKMTLADSEVCFLRLSRRRGWITDRRVTSAGGSIKIGSLPAAIEVSDTVGKVDRDDSTVSALSVASSTAMPGAMTRRRHRPPRRQRETGTSKDSGTPGRNRSPGKYVTPQKSGSPVPDDKTLMTPSSNISLMSEDESFDVSTHYNVPTGVVNDRRREIDTHAQPSLFLMKVNAPRGLRILDAPHFQVSSLIHGTQEGSPMTHTLADAKSSKSLSKGSIFHTMAVSHTTKGIGGRGGSPAVFDSYRKTRSLPRGVLFESSKRMESSGAFDMASGLIKLADGSGWAIVPKQEDLDEQYRRYRGGATSSLKGDGATRAYEEVGNAIVPTDENTGQPRDDPLTVQWLRIVARNGVDVGCPPPSPLLAGDEDNSPTSSAGGSSSIVSGGGSNFGILTTQDSDVASSVGSAFLDAMFRTPRKNEARDTDAQSDPRLPRSRTRGGARSEPQIVPTLLQCGTCVEVDRWTEDLSSWSVCQDYVRLRGGQGWIPLNSQGKVAAVNISRPDLRVGSFWFRVVSQRGIKVRYGPSRKATSIKLEDGDYFRFECGEFLRASEIVTIFHTDKPSESFAKLYRNRHAQLNRRNAEFRSLASMTSPAEWVQVHGDDNLYLEECGEQPRIERHSEGWRYNVIADSGVHVRVGPSFSAESSGLLLLAGESILVCERVNPAREDISWLRLKNGKGWVHDLDMDGNTAMIAHSLRHRAEGPLTARAPLKSDRPAPDDVAYNTIIARLFHSDGGAGRPHSLPSCGNK